MKTSSPLSLPTLSTLSTLSTHSLTLTCLGNRLHQVSCLLCLPPQFFCPSSYVCLTPQISTTPSLIFFFSFSCDLLLGILAPPPPTSFSTSAQEAMEATVSRLQTLITWMMENPAGLKLSSVLSQALGQFFLYHIHLWVTYILLLLPIITPHLINLLPLLLHLPLSLQVGS